MRGCSGPGGGGRWSEGLEAGKAWGRDLGKKGISTESVPTNYISRTAFTALLNSATAAGT